MKACSRFNLLLFVVSLALLGSASGALAWGPLPMPQAGVAAQQQAQSVALVGQIGGLTSAVAIQDSYAYIGVGPRLVVLDVADPAKPVVVGQTGVLPGVVQDVAVAGDYAYVAAAYSGLRIVNVSNPAAPTEAGYCDTPGTAYGVAVAGNYAYVADYSGLRIVNVSNPVAPTEAGYYDAPGNAVDVAVAGNYAYVAGGSFGLRIVNVANPAAPTQVGYYYFALGYTLGVAVAGNHAVVSGRPRWST